MITFLLVRLHVACHTIKDSRTFHHEYLSTHPSKYAIVEYAVQYMSDLVQNGTLILDIHTDDHWSPEDECLNQKYGQLRNRNLHLPLSLASSGCVQSGDNSEMIFCTGKKAIQDYIPRQYSFSIRLDSQGREKTSLNEVYFNIIFLTKQNYTECSRMPYVQSETMRINCSKFYSATSFPNLVGSQTLFEGITSPNNLYVTYLKVLILNRTSSCYKRFFELVCYIYIPKCEETKLLTIPPCREMCEDFFEGCGGFLFSDQFEMNCQYLPPYNGTIPCFHEPVTCEPPSNVNNLRQTSAEYNNYYSPNSEIEYGCTNEGHSIEGDVARRCLYSGQWSSEPKCISKRSNTLLKVLLPIAILLILIISGISYFRLKRKALSEKTSTRMEVNTTRMKENDAFVCCERKDAPYVKFTIVPELEQYHDPPPPLNYASLNEISLSVWPLLIILSVL